MEASINRTFWNEEPTLPFIGESDLIPQEKTVRLDAYANPLSATTDLPVQSLLGHQTVLHPHLAVSVGSSFQKVLLMLASIMLSGTLNLPCPIRFLCDPSFLYPETSL